MCSWEAMSAGKPSCHQTEISEERHCHAPPRQGPLHRCAFSVGVSAHTWPSPGLSSLPIWLPPTQVQSLRSLPLPSHPLPEGAAAVPCGSPRCPHPVQLLSLTAALGLLLAQEITMVSCFLEYNTVLEPWWTQTVQFIGLF